MQLQPQVQILAWVIDMILVILLFFALFSAFSDFLLFLEAGSLLTQSYRVAMGFRGSIAIRRSLTHRI